MMDTVRKTITQTSKQDAWIKAQIERGDYTNDSEYIRDLVRRDQAGSTRPAVIETTCSAATTAASWWCASSMQAWMLRIDSDLQPGWPHGAYAASGVGTTIAAASRHYVRWMRPEDPLR